MAATAGNSPPPLPSSAPPPSMNSRRTSSGIFHNVKRAVFGPNKSAMDDSEFKATQDEFNSLHQLLLSLRTNLAHYNRSAVTLTTSARATTDTFADIIKDTARANPYSSTLLSSTHAHNELAERVESSGGVCTRELINTVEQQMELHKAMVARIEERIKLRTDYLYYAKKVEGLLKEREERHTKGKAEKAADTDKLSRNNEKLTESQQRYTLYNGELMHDLQMLYISRMKTYGPCLTAFVSAEKRFSADYYQCMRSVDRDDGGSGGGSNGLSIGVGVGGAAAEYQRLALVPAEHSPVVDQSMDMSPFHPFGDNSPNPVGGLTPTNAMRANAAGHSAADSLSAAAVQPPRKLSNTGGAAPSYYAHLYENANNTGTAQVSIQNHLPAVPSAPILSPPFQQQPFAFNQLAWPELDQPAVAASGPRVDQFSDPFANNAAVNPFDDLDEFSAAFAATSANHSSFASASSSSAARPTSSLPASVPEYHPAPYVAPAVVEAPAAAVAVLGASELEAGLEDDEDTDEAGEGVVAGELGEVDEQEGVPSAALVAHTPAPATAPAAANHTPPASAFASMHSAAAPRAGAPPAIPVSGPSLRPAVPSSKPSISPPHTPVSSQSDNPFDDD